MVQVKARTRPRRTVLSEPLSLYQAAESTHYHSAEGLWAAESAHRFVVVGIARAPPASPFTGPLQELVTPHAWGHTWQRKGINLRSLSIVTASMLVASGRMHELKIHVRGAPNMA